MSFVAHNGGTIVHELIVLKVPAGSQAAGMTVGGDRKVSESGISAEASKPCGAGAGGGLGAGTTGWVTVTLPAGTYALVCNEPGHYAAGMLAEFAVR